jgi:ribosomal-protein-alanine N-acetyltransferase
MSLQDTEFDFGRIRLIHAEPAHLGEWKVFMQDPEVMRFIFGGWNPDDAELGDMLTRNGHYWSRYRMGWWSVVERRTGDIIANCVLDVSCSGASEIGYIIRQQSWRQGFGKEIVESLCRYSFDVELIEALKAYVNVGNEGSIKILERLGFTRDSQAVFAGRPCINFGMKRNSYRGVIRRQSL